MKEIKGYFKNRDGVRYKAIRISDKEVVGLELNPVNCCKTRANAVAKTFQLNDIRFVEMSKDGKTRFLTPGKSCFSTKTTLEFYGL